MRTLCYGEPGCMGRLHRDETGQGTTEYVLIILGTVLFLIAATFLMRGYLTTAVAAIGTWIGTVGPPPAAPAP